MLFKVASLVSFYAALAVWTSEPTLAASASHDPNFMIPKNCSPGDLLPSVAALSSEPVQRMPYPQSSTEQTGVYGPITNGQRMARHLNPEIVAGIGAQSGALLRHGSLSPMLREMIIVRTGYRTGSAYEVYQHRSLALSVGVTEEKLDTLACVHPTGLEESERAAIAFVDELLTINRPTDEALNAVRSHFSNAQVMEIVVVTGNWWLLARMLETAGVPLDSGNIGQHGVSKEDHR
ncbi:carboxymuconolactone decarboxylase family protein [Paraburkholderia sediminicola]|nr:carboxymuconolactone decarboxylase family protein [Paraburkholderia sediminicola]